MMYTDLLDDCPETIMDATLEELEELHALLDRDGLADLDFLADYILGMTFLHPYIDDYGQRHSAARWMINYQEYA